MINIKKFESIFKAIRLNKGPKGDTDHKIDSSNIQIQIDGNIELFKDEKEKIIEGAKQLLQMGKADNVEDAIITFAVMFRGLKFSGIRKTEDGTTIVVLRETAQGITKSITDDDEIKSR